MRRNVLDGPDSRLGDNVTVTTNQSLSSQVTVNVDDTGPFARDQNGLAISPLQPDPHDVIDLTPAAMRALIGQSYQTIGKVSVTVTEPPHL